MIFKVRMMSCVKQDLENPRLVDVPNEEVVSDNMKLLESIFKWGQNDYQPRNSYSVSVGDVVELDKKLYICQSLGWKEITEKEFDEYSKVPVDDRRWCDLSRPV